MSRLIDLSHAIEDGVITYRGLPAPIVCDFLTREDSAAHYAEGTSFHIGRIDMVANTGTYVDSPFHRFADGRDLSRLELASLADLEGICVHLEEDVSSRTPIRDLPEKGAQSQKHPRAIGPEAFEGRDVAGKAVLVHTGWSRHWNTDAYFEGHPFLTRQAAEWLKNAGAALVGIDSLNIDDIDDYERPVHTVLLGADIPIVEHMCRLDRIPDEGFRFHAAPVKVKGMGTFPVRAYAVVNK